MQLAIPKVLRWLAIAGALAITAMALASPPTARAAGCDRIELGGERYAFYKQHMSCDTAKDNARHLRREPTWEPRRFDCDSGTNFQRSGFCRHVRRDNRYFGWHARE